MHIAWLLKLVRWLFVMALLTAALVTALFNFAFAAGIYLSFRGWLVPHEPSGVQAIGHLLFTAPLVILTSICFFILSLIGKCRPAFWKINSLGLLIPIITFQDDGLRHGYDKFGLLVTCFIAAALIFLYVRHIWHYARR
ncbi:hypothetical protein [Pseudomonas sp.]|uniref:hypothetical protein n=1 Tax=Pseudomonas sp. TaxID=306 RepID=UPI00262F4FD2|nr:hypothetical protein [Pseudomonas sp.]